MLSFKEAPPTEAVTLTEGITVREFAEKLGVKAKDLIRMLFDRGVMATINHVLDVELAQEIAGDLIIVGAPFDDTAGTWSGAAHLWRHDGAQWMYEGAVHPVIPGIGQQFGTSVALAGEQALVGAPYGGGAPRCVGGARPLDGRLQRLVPIRRQLRRRLLEADAQGWPALVDGHLRVAPVAQADAGVVDLAQQGPWCEEDGGGEGVKLVDHRMTEKTAVLSAVGNVIIEAINPTAIRYFERNESGLSPTWK